jgi:hypothetical protein
VTKTPTTTEAPASDAGVVFPLVEGRRSTLATGQRIVAASTKRVDTAIHEAARDESNWRSRYIHHFREMTRLSAQQHALLIASDGLLAVHQEFRNRRHGAELALAEALTVPRANFAESWSVAGAADRVVNALVVPYQGERLEGDQLRRQLDEWVARGIAEPSFGAAITSVLDNPQWLDLRDLTFVTMGAASEMGPYRPLLRWGAHVAAVDVPDPTVWRELIRWARTTGGRLTLPIRRPLDARSSDESVARNAGLDIITEAPEVAAWLTALPGAYTLGDYVYAHGSTHVRTSTAIDAIVKHVFSTRGDVGLAYLATPTDAYAVSSEVVEFSRRSNAGAGALVSAARGLTGGRLYRPNYPTVESTTDGLRFGMADALVSQQGPNYALAKRIQRWRAQHARAHGHFVSINVAPATRTRSVMRNRILSAAYAGAHKFGLEIFEPDTSSALMAALLVHDLRNPRALAHPDVPLDQSFDLLVAGALHGGMWRIPYDPRSVLGMAVAFGMVPAADRRSGS